MTEENKHFFPTIDFYDFNGEEHRVVEIIENKTLDGYKKVTYKTADGEEISFVMK